jgi:hypothetical protein
MRPEDPETISLRATIIDGEQYADDYKVIWRGLVIGRILKEPGAPLGKPQWWYGCNLHGQPQAAADRGHGIDLKDCQRRFKMLWARIRVCLTDQDIARAFEVAGHIAERGELEPSRAEQLRGFWRFCFRENSRRSPCTRGQSATSIER